MVSETGGNDHFHKDPHDLHLYGGFCFAIPSLQRCCLPHNSFNTSIHEENKELSNTEQFLTGSQSPEMICLFLSNTAYITPVTLQPNFQFVKMAVCHVPACS